LPLKKGLPEEKKREEENPVVEDEFGLQETFRDVFIMEGYDVRGRARRRRGGYRTYLQFKPDLLFTTWSCHHERDRPGKEDTERQPADQVIYISGFFGLRNVKQKLQEEY